MDLETMSFIKKSFNRLTKDIMNQITKLADDLQNELFKEYNKEVNYDKTKKTRN